MGEAELVHPSTAQVTRGCSDTTCKAALIVTNDAEDVAADLHSFRVPWQSKSCARVDPDLDPAEDAPMRGVRVMRPLDFNGDHALAIQIGEKWLFSLHPLLSLFCSSSYALVTWFATTLSIVGPGRADCYHRAQRADPSPPHPLTYLEADPHYPPFHQDPLSLLSQTFPTPQQCPFFLRPFKFFYTLFLLILILVSELVVSPPILLRYPVTAVWDQPPPHIR